ncbi:DUF748 domain-containing protein [Marinifilum sp.]|uniref:DUF748 domain-containing protein n=1 Tax=Marinifilum sp. TaxID=2033137 RepID=UPI003BACF42E
MISISMVMFILFFFLSSIVKNYVVNHSEELIGRKLEIAELHFNYIKLSAQINNLDLYEDNGVDKFVSCKELYFNVSPWKLIKGEYSLSQIYLDGLDVSLIQDRIGFNFDDMLASDVQTVDNSEIQDKNATTKFSIYNIKIKNGYVAYFDKEKDNLLDLKNINLDLPLLAWNNQNSKMGVDFSVGGDGHVGIIANVDHASDRYKVNLNVKEVNIAPFMTYVKDYMKISSLEGRLNTCLSINGSLKDFMDVYIQGNASVQNLIIHDFDGNKFLATQATNVKFDSLNLGTSHFEIAKLEVQKPEIYATLFKDDTNFDRVLEPVMSLDSVEVENDTIAEKSNLFYSVDSIVVNSGFVQFSDKTLNRDFVYDIKDIAMNIGTIAANTKGVALSYFMRLNNQGELKGDMKFSLQEVYDFSLKAKLKGLELMSFSPYTEFYMARPITQGTLNYDCSIEMTANQLENQNNIKISEIDFGKKTNDPNTIKVPLRLALYLLKDQNDNIEIDLPVSGNPKEPDFKIGKIIGKTLLNFLVKTATKPFGILGSISGTNPKNIEIIPLQYSLVTIGEKEKSTLRDISAILEKKPGLVFTFTQETNLNMERDYLALQKCVKDYCKSNSKGFPDLRAEKWQDWANENLAFKSYLMKDSIDHTVLIMDLCLERIGAAKANVLLDSLLIERNVAITQYLTDSLNISQGNFIVKTADLRNMSDQQKKPKYRVEVSIQ